MSTQPRVATSKHHEVVIPDAFPTQLSFGMTLVEGVIKFIVTIFSFAKAQRKMKWVQSQLQMRLTAWIRLKIRFRYRMLSLAVS